MKINVIRSYIFPSMVSQCRKRRNGKVVKFHLSPRYKDHTNMSSFFFPLFQHWYISTNDQLISPRPVACIYHQQTIDRWIFPSLSLSLCPSSVRSFYNFSFRTALSKRWMQDVHKIHKNGLVLLEILCIALKVEKFL